MRGFWAEFRREKSGVFSLGLAGAFVLLMLAETAIIPFPDARSRWRDITYWENNPRSVPPVWINWFSSKKRAESRELREPRLTEKQAGKARIVRAEFSFDYQADAPPTDVLLICKATGSPVMSLAVTRPDGQTLTLFK